MSFYEWVCRDCAIYWEEEHRIGTAPSKQNCPKCDELCHRKWDTPPTIHFKGEGWSGVNKQTGFMKKGGSDEGNLKLQDGCRDRMAEGWKAYARYDPSQGYLDDVGAKKHTETEFKEKLDASRKLSQHTYDKAGINPYDKYKPQ
jgi:predicted nucleic acid-binding Zn ribbon protein